MVFDEKDLNRAILSRRLHGGNIDRKPRRALPPAFADFQKVKGASFRVHFTVQRFGMVGSFHQCPKSSGYISGYLM